MVNSFSPHYRYQTAPSQVICHASNVLSDKSAAVLIDSIKETNFLRITRRSRSFSLKRGRGKIPLLQEAREAISNYTRSIETNTPVENAKG
jgi:hypothetical protein